MGKNLTYNYFRNHGRPHAGECGEVSNKKENTMEQKLINAFDLDIEENDAEAFAEDGISYYMNSIGKYDVLSKNEEQALATRMVKGDVNARNELISHNLKLVPYILKQFKGCSYIYDDLLGVGNIALIEAADHFDCTQDFRFSTYAGKCIYHAVCDYLTQNRRMRIPANVLKKVNILKDIEEEFEFHNGRKPTVDELAAKSGETKAKVKELRNYFYDADSLQDPCGNNEEEDYTIGDKTAGDYMLEPENAYEAKAEIEDVHKALETLNDNEKAVITRLYGFDGEEPMTHEAIGKTLKINRTGVHAIEAVAKRKIKRYLGDDYCKAA